MTTRSAVLSILYEHPDWFRPLFRELERRSVPYDAIHADDFDLDGNIDRFRGTLFFNRISPSAWRRERGAAIAIARDLLAFLEHSGVDTVNGARTFAFETSKASQTLLLEQLGIRTPRTIVVLRPERLVAASRKLAFPLIVKPNVGGSGAGIRKFDQVDELIAAVEREEIDRGYDGSVLLQEYHAPRGHRIHRVETLGAKFLYGITIHLGDQQGFDLCPADICRTTSGDAIASAACPVESVKRGLTVENLNPTTRVIETVERIARAAALDVGGIEFLESDRDGAIYYYDINALSNFVADAPRVVGFDPTERLVDALVDRLGWRAA